MSRKILVTGASSDVGIELIKSLLKKDITVLAFYNSSPDNLNSLLIEGAKNLFIFKCDLSVEEEIKEQVKAVSLNHGVLDGFVHLAAPALLQIRYQKTCWDDFQKDLDIQLKSAHVLLQHFLPEMAERGSGNVVFMLSSVTLNVPPIAMVQYSTVKYAMLGFMKALASEYRTKGVNINAVSPSLIGTKFLKNIPPLAIELAARNHPRKRIASPADIYPVIEFLLSDEARFIHGSNIPISGGETF